MNEVPGMITEVKNQEASVKSSSKDEIWRRAFRKIMEKRQSSIAENAQYPTNENLPCKNTTFYQCVVDSLFSLIIFYSQYIVTSYTQYILP